VKKPREQPAKTIAAHGRFNLSSSTGRLPAAGMAPSRLQRMVRWKRDRVMEAVLTRALRNESLIARRVEPHSLIEAGQRFFGSWATAVAAAALDRKLTHLPPRQKKSPTGRGTG
jgi:hypothetical protein